MPPAEPQNPIPDKKVKPKGTKDKLLSSGMHFSLRNLIIFALIFGLAGGYVLWRTLAAAPVIATIQAESMNLPAGASVIVDTSASGGKAVKLTQNGSATSSLSLPSTVNSITVTTKGSKCKSTWPKVSVSLDGNSLLPSTTVSSSTWKSYSVDTNLTSGNHSLKVDYSSGSRNCANLYLDVLTFYGPEPPPVPIPTVALSASPTSIAPGGSSTLTWASTNASSCTASGAWNGTQPTSGSTNTGALNTTSTYKLTCTGAGGSASISGTVTVVNPTTTTSYGFALGYRTQTRSSTDLAFELDQVKAIANGRSVVLRTDSINNTTGQNQLNTWIGAVKARGYEPMLTLFGTSGVKSLSEISAFATAQATKWKDKVRLYEFMNEPDLNGWTPEEYTAGLKAVYKAIKQIDPSATVIAGALWKWDAGPTAKPYVSPGVGGTIEWVQRMYAAGAKDNFDMLSLHLYGDPDIRAPSWNIWDHAFYTNPSVRSIMNSYGDSAKPIISTESGGSATKIGDSEQTQSTKIDHGFNHLASGQIGMYLVYTMMDDEVPGFGLLRPDKTPRMAWFTYQQRAK